MTAIVGLFDIAAQDTAALARAALAAMHPRGKERVELWHEGGSALGAVFDAWEVAGDRPEAARLASDERAVVATDATLYYLSDLTAGLRAAGYPNPVHSPAALILAAYRAWGDKFLDFLEGDFALILWDRVERRVIAARDHTGVRTLFYTTQPSGLAVASRLDGLTTLPGFDRELNLVSVADDALFMRVQNPLATAYANATRIPAGHRLDWRPSSTPSVARWWEVPVFLRGDGPPFAEATEELRRLIVAAVAERTAHPGGTAIWLSGGYDSSTLFAASQIGARERAGQPAYPVSISYPPGDMGREDELIEESARFWHLTPTWLRADEVPPLTAPVELARLRDEPMYHTYETANRALARTTRSAGFRAALVGNGGDQFFSAGVIRLADHFRTGRFITLASEWREAGGGNDWRLFFRTVLMPNLPAYAIAVANELRQPRTLQHRLTRQLPTWANPHFSELEALEGLNRAALPRRRGEGHAALDQSWFLRQVTGERVNAAYTGTGLLDGIEIRSPLFDPRVIRFAAGRPIGESYSKRENKRLLRAAFKGYLPDAILGPRIARTGLPQRTLFRTATEHAQWVTAECTKGMILADLSVIDGSKFLDRAARWARREAADVEEAAGLVASAQAECWMRARFGKEA
jgi:asparagine synthetase B (glutamine-hydrolysing)